MELLIFLVFTVHKPYALYTMVGYYKTTRRRHRLGRANAAMPLVQHLPLQLSLANGQTKMPDGIINNQKCINYTY